jgi:multidrug efflux pump subunit AcrA (membrane-fusion protein)
MKRSINLVFLLSAVILAGFLLAGCDAMQNMMPGQEPAEATEAPVKPILGDDNSITSEGRLVPKKEVNLAFSTTGQVDEILVEEGEQVKKGDIIARLTGRKQLEAAISLAELELFNAKQARKALDDNLDDEQNASLLALNNARQALDDAERKLGGLGGTADQTDIDLAYTQLLFAEEELDKAKERFQPYANKPETNLIRARLQVQLANAQQAYDDALRKYNALTGAANTFDLDQARADVEIAKGQLALAQERYDLLQAGPDPDLVASADERIKATEAQLEATKDDLARLDLVATMDGTVVDSDLLVGKSVSPGQPVVQLVDFSEWFVETEDLSEIEVVDIALGQQASLTADALPDVKFNGEVVEISDTYLENRGDIVYTVRIKLDEVDPRLRWGMTVVAEFAKK